MRRLLIFLVLGMALTSALFWLFAPGAGEGPPTPTKAGAEQVISRAFEIRDGRPVAGPATISLPRGAVLRLQGLTDRDDELHVHGYDREQAIRAGEPFELRLALERAGRFPVELHVAEQVLTVLEVSPQ